jgi:hypothetical protein
MQTVRESAGKGVQLLWGSGGSVSADYGRCSHILVGLVRWCQQPLKAFLPSERNELTNTNSSHTEIRALAEILSHTS